MRPFFLKKEKLDKDNLNFINSIFKQGKNLLNFLDRDKEYEIHDFESDFESQDSIVFSAGMKCRYYYGKLNEKDSYKKPFLVPVISSNAFDTKEPCDNIKNHFNKDVYFLKHNKNLYRCGFLFLPPNSSIIKTQGSFDPYIFLLNLTHSNILVECNGADSLVLKENDYCISDYNAKIFKLQNLENSLSISLVCLLKTSTDSKTNFRTLSINITN